MYKSDSLIIVVGNQSGDLDSVIGAYVKSQIIKHETQVTKKVLCILNFPQKEMVLKKEISYLLDLYSIKLNEFIFIDKLDLELVEKSSRNKKLSIILTDHNEPLGKLKKYKQHISEIVDHHQIINPIDRNIKQMIHPTGSCSTLIAEDLFKKKEPEINSKLSDELRILFSLLYAVIFIDTSHIEYSSHIDIYRDKAMLKKLESFIDVNKGLLKKLLALKFDTTDFSVINHLKRDKKSWYCGTLHYAISTIYINNKIIKKNREHWNKEINLFMSEYNLDILFMMHFIQLPSINRQLTFACKSSFPHKDKLIGSIGNSHLFILNKNCDLKNHLFFFEQTDVSYSRKKIQIVINKIIENIEGNYEI